METFLAQDAAMIRAMETDVDVDDDELDDDDEIGDDELEDDDL